MTQEYVFEPFADIGEVVGILTTEGSWIYRVITYAEPLPPSEEGMVKDFGAISNGETLENQELPLIKMRSNELGQFRFEVLDPIKVKVAQPQGITRFLTKNTVAWVTQLTKERDPSMRLTEFFVHGGDAPVFTVKNDSGKDLTKSRVQFYGWRFILQDWKEWANERKKRIEEALDKVESEIEEERGPRREAKVRRKRTLLRQLREELAKIELELAFGEPLKVKRVVATGRGGR